MNFLEKPKVGKKFDPEFLNCSNFLTGNPIFTNLSLYQSLDLLILSTVF